MKVIIAGLRNFCREDIVIKAIKLSGFKINTVISGHASGVDSIGEKWARDNNIPVVCFPADWKTHGKSAGPIRNQAMVNYSEALIACWDYTSRGTLDIIKKASTKGLKVYIFDIRPFL